MSKIFLSYRREESLDISGRIYDWLRRAFGMDAVFKDVNTIAPGGLFKDEIDKALASSTALVAVIGRRWLTLTGEDGRPRLQDSKDFVRLELEEALRRGVRIFPVFVDGAAPLPRAAMPESLVTLADFQGLAIRPDPDFYHDMKRPIRELANLVPRALPRETTGNETSLLEIRKWLEYYTALDESNPPAWTCRYAGRRLFCICDPNADRMRLMTPILDPATFEIVDPEALGPSELHRILQANYESALDARYGIAKGYLWAVYLHRLSSLTENDFSSALKQVSELAWTYGTSYSSHSMIFLAGDNSSDR